MNVSRLLCMTRKDIVLTTRESFFLFMVISPIVVTIVLNAALGSADAPRATLAVFGGDELVSMLEEEPSLKIIRVSSEEDLYDKVLEGEYDAGLVFPEQPRGSPELYISGKSLMNDRLTIGATLIEVFRKMTGTEDIVTFETKISGTEEFSWKVRLIPFLLIIATVVGGLIISSSLIEEREVKTLNAVLVTPITPLEVILAKSLYGLFLGLILGVLILVLNSSFSGGIFLVLFFLVLGTLFTVGLGLMAGVIMENITDLIARMKLFNLFLMLPAMIILFPQIPQWIGKFFPTFYFIDPILSITQKGATWSDVWWEAVILIIIDCVVLLLASRVLRERMLGKEIRI